MPRTLITGITGQDGSCLIEFLLEKGYEVHGIIRRASGFNTDVTRLRSRGWEARTGPEQGIQSACRWYLSHGDGRRQ